MSGRSFVLGLAVLVPAAAALAEEGAGSDDGPVVYREEGKASYYDDKFQGKKTASGERFDQKERVAAHPELPLGSNATVVNPDTGKKVEVEIVDRGPYVKGRDIDLSKSAAKDLGISKEGVADVRVEATKDQVERAIDKPEETPKVEKALTEARQEAAQEGTPQPKPVPKLEPPQGDKRSGK